MCVCVVWVMLIQTQVLVYLAFINSRFLPGPILSFLVLEERKMLVNTFGVYMLWEYDIVFNMKLGVRLISKPMNLPARFFRNCEAGKLKPRNAHWNVNSIPVLLHILTGLWTLYYQIACHSLHNRRILVENHRFKCHYHESKYMKTTEWSMF